MSLVRRNPTYKGQSLGVDNKKWPHSFEFILFPPSKHFDSTGQSKIRQVDETSMLMHNSGLSYRKASKLWKGSHRTKGTDDTIFQQLDKFIFRFSDKGTIVEGNLGIENKQLNDEIKNLCE